MSKISQRLDLRQSQSLVMTPQLQQAIKLLQMNNIELSDFVEEELERNPLLEKDTSENNMDSDDQESPAGQDGHKETEAGHDDPIKDDFDSGWDSDPAPSASQDRTDTSFDAGSADANIGSGGNHNFEDIENSVENRLSKQDTLRDHLMNQLHIKFNDSRRRMIGALLIDNLDENGYLRHKPDELAKRFSCPPEQLDNVLAALRQFDPTGVFAHDLADCLALQLEEQGLLDEPMQKLLDHIDLLGKHDFAGLAEKCGVNDTFLKDMIAEIRALNPKPAGSFEHFVVQTVVPDVLMKRLPKELGGGWRVALNNDTLPKVLVNQDYFTEVAQKTRDKKDKAYLNEQLQSATWLTKALDQRAKTILKVAGEIVEQQEGFFLYGLEFLKPLVLRDIAEKIEMHESTVSRVTNNKYIGTPRGIFELKYFFSSGIAGSDGETHSAEAIRARVKSLIEAEKPDKVLSDDKIADILSKDGIDIARRTVTKYREALHIPSSVQRRREKKNF